MKLLMLVVVGWLWHGQACAAMEPPAKSEMMEVTGGGFTLDVGAGDIAYHYALSLHLEASQYTLLYMTATFENPSNPSTPLVEEMKVPGSSQQIQLESNLVTGLQNGKHYKVQVELYSDEARTHLVDELTQIITFAMNMPMLQEIQDGLKVPGQTSAGSVLQKDIIRTIRAMQHAYAPDCRYEIVDTRAAGVEENSVLEEWAIRSCEQEVVYPIKLTPVATGGTNFTISTPQAYVKNPEAKKAEVFLTNDGKWKVKKPESEETGSK